MALALGSLQEAMYVSWFPDYIYFNYHASSENIRSITDLVDPEDDCGMITAVHDQIDKGTAGRRRKLEEAHASLKGFTFSRHAFLIFMIYSCIQSPSSCKSPRCRPYIGYPSRQRAFCRAPRGKPSAPLWRAIIPRQGPERRRELRHEYASGAHATQRGVAPVGRERPCCRAST